MKQVDFYQGQKAAKRAGAIIALLGLLKGAVGWLTQTPVLISDAIHGASDLISIATAWLGLKIAQQKPTQKFPYGFYKVENLAALLVALLIFWAGGEFLQQGLQQLKTPPQLTSPILTLTTAFLAVLVDLGVSRYLMRVGRAIRSPSLIGAAKEKAADVLISSTVVFALIASYFQIPYIEGLVVILIALLLVKIAFEVGWESLLVLLDVGPDEEFLRQVEKVVSQVPGVAECLAIRLRRAGPVFFGEAKIGVRKKVTIEQIQQLIGRVQQAVRRHFPQVEVLTVNVEPFVGEYRHLAIPVEKKGDLQVPLAKTFGQTPFLLFVNLKKEKILGYYFIRCPQSARHQGLARARLVVRQRAGFVLTPKIGEIAFGILQSNLIEVYRCRAKTAQGALKAFVSGRVTPIVSPKKVYQQLGSGDKLPKAK